MSSPMTTFRPGPSSSNPSPQLITPAGTPPNINGHQNSPHFFETRLQQLLADCHTHPFDGEERETPAERRMSFGGGVPIPTGRRPSFLSSLSLTRPFTSSNPSSSSSTPIHTPTTASHLPPHLPAGLTMTSSTTSSAGLMDPIPDPITRPKSTSHVEHQTKYRTDHTGKAVEHPQQIQRSQTAPMHSQSQPASLAAAAASHTNAANSQHVPGPADGPVKVSGFSLGQLVQGKVKMHKQEDKRHFDPSKEPRLLGLL